MLEFVDAEKFITSHKHQESYSITSHKHQESYSITSHKHQEKVITSHKQQEWCRKEIAR
jgi:hypothetical protein